MWKKLVGIIKFTSRPSVAASNTSIYSHSEILILFCYSWGCCAEYIWCTCIFFSVVRFIDTKQNHKLSMLLCFELSRWSCAAGTCGSGCNLCSNTALSYLITVELRDWKLIFFQSSCQLSAQLFLYQLVAGSILSGLIPFLSCAFRLIRELFSSEKKSEKITLWGRVEVIWRWNMVDYSINVVDGEKRSSKSNVAYQVLAHI